MTPGKNPAGASVESVVVVVIPWVVSIVVVAEVLYSVVSPDVPVEYCAEVFGTSACSVVVTVK